MKSSLARPRQAGCIFQVADDDGDLSVEVAGLNAANVHNLRFAAEDPRLQPILSVPALAGDQENGDVVAWAVEREGGGRGFGTSTGHFFEN